MWVDQDNGLLQNIRFNIFLDQTFKDDEVGMVGDWNVPRKDGDGLADDRGWSEVNGGAAGEDTDRQKEEDAGIENDQDAL